MNGHIAGVLKMVAGILFLAFSLVLAVLVLSTDGHEPVWIMWPAVVTMLFAFGLVFWGGSNINQAEARSLNQITSTVQAATATLTRQQHIAEPAPVSIETPRHVIDLIPIAVRDLPR